MLEHVLRQNKRKNVDYIKTLPRIVNIRGKQIIPYDITNRNSKELLAYRWHRCNANIEQYYFIKHKITLKYPNLPCIIMKGLKGHLYFYPIETLYISNTINDDPIDELTVTIDLITIEE
jgi:hypothetical protein